MVDRGGEVQLFPRYPCKNWYKNWYLHFYKTYDHQICQAGTSIGFDSNETNQAGAGDVITSRSRDKLKHLLNQSVYGHQTWQDGNLVDGPLPIKSHDPLVMWSCKIMWQTKIIISPLTQSLWPPNVAVWWLTLMGSCLYSLYSYNPLITWSCKIT